VLPTEESSKAISDCEAAAAQAFAAVNQAKTEIRSKQKVYVREGKKKTAQVVSFVEKAREVAFSTRLTTLEGSPRVAVLYH